MPFVLDWAFGSNAVFGTLAAVFLGEAIAGGLPGLSCIFDFPAIFVRVVARFANRRLNRPMQCARSRRVRGAIVLLFPPPVVALAGYAWATGCLTLPDGWAVEASLVSLCEGLRRPLVASAAILGALVRAGLERAREVLAGRFRRRDGHCRRARPAVKCGPGDVDRLSDLLGALFAPTAHPAAALLGMRAAAGLARLARGSWAMGAVSGALGLGFAVLRRFAGGVDRRPARPQRRRISPARYGSM